VARGTRKRGWPACWGCSRTATEIHARGGSGKVIVTLFKSKVGVTGVLQKIYLRLWLGLRQAHARVLLAAGTSAILDVILDVERNGAV